MLLLLLQLHATAAAAAAAVLSPAAAPSPPPLNLLFHVNSTFSFLYFSPRAMALPVFRSLLVFRSTSLLLPSALPRRLLSTTRLAPKDTSAAESLAPTSLALGPGNSAASAASAASVVPSEPEPQISYPFFVDTSAVVRKLESQFTPQVSQLLMKAMVISMQEK